MPASLAPYPERPIFEYLSDAARGRPGHPALIFKGGRISCAELERLSNDFAAAMQHLGVKKGDRVALVLPNSPQFLIAEIGAWKAGAIALPINPIYTERELEGPLAESGAETVVVLTPFYQRVKGCQARTSLRHVIATNIKEFLPPILRLLFTLAREKKEGHRITLARGDLWFRELLAAHRGSRRPEVSLSPGDPAVMLMSGGTTGRPKGVIGSHGSLVASGLQLRAWTRGVRRDWEDAILLPLPLFHVYANAGVQALALVGHNPLALVPNPRDIGDLLHTIAKVRPVFFSAVPTLFIALLNHPAVSSRKVDFSPIKVSFSGAAALMADTKKRFEEMTGGRIIEGYSLTEAMMACTVNPVRGTNKIGSVGLPLPDVEARIVDAETGDRDLPPNEIGEILLRGPQLMSGYWSNPQETAEALRAHGSGGPWLHTGDLGFLDEEGYLFIVDRKKDLIKASGYQVWPREVEEVLATHPAVAEVGVAGVPDAVKGEVVKAWVVLRAGSSVTQDDLRGYAKQRLAPYKAPAEIEFRSELPKTMVGKVLRRALVAEEKRKKGTG